MDIDAWVVAHQSEWFRLAELTRLARKPKSLAPDQLDELVQLYQRVSAHLASARVTYAGDQAVISRLTMVVSDAHTALYSQRDTNVSTSLRTFATETFPTSVIRIRWFIAASALLTFIPWAVFNVWLAISPRAVDAIGPATLRDQYIHDDFVNYYRSESASAFASQVFWNNVRVAILAFALGILLCVFTAYVLAQNGALGGTAGGLFTNVGEWQKFWGLILPHGLLELSAVVVAGAAGLRIGWTVIDPGARTRRNALSEEGRSAGNVVLGLVVAFLLAALVEGFVTGRTWSTWLRVGIGVGVFTTFWGWTLLFAWRARAERRVEAATQRHQRRSARQRSGPGLQPS